MWLLSQSQLISPPPLPKPPYPFSLETYLHPELTPRSFGQRGWENYFLQRQRITFKQIISMNQERLGTAMVLQLWSTPVISSSLLHNTGPSFIAMWLQSRWLSLNLSLE